VIYLLHGKDAYRIRQSLNEIRDPLRTEPGVLESNTATLDGRGLNPQELIGNATAMPFLAPHRVVIVEGLLKAISEVKGARRKKPSPDDPLEPWRRVAEQLGDRAAMPETTTLVFIESEITKTNAAFTIFAPIARVIDHPALKQGELAPWIDATAKKKKVKLAPAAVSALARLIGPDLWMLDTEIEKLATYAGGATIDADLVAEVTSAAQDTKAWDFTDALIDGKETRALDTMRALIAEGAASQMLLVMVGRQYRQLVMVKDMRERRANKSEIERVSGVKPFKTDAVAATASHYTWPALRAAYARILDADLSVKRGESDDETALQLLVHDLCAMSAQSRRAASAGRR